MCSPSTTTAVIFFTPPAAHRCIFCDRALLARPLLVRAVDSVFPTTITCIGLRCTHSRIRKCTGCHFRNDWFILVTPAHTSVAPEVKLIQVVLLYVHSFRRYHSIDIDSFLADLQCSRLITNPPKSLGSLLITYNTTLSFLLDKHAPVITRFSSCKSKSNPWFTSTLRAFKSTVTNG